VADRQQFRYDGLPKPLAVSADQPVELAVVYYAAGRAAALADPPVDPGEYVARISFGGDAHCLGASKDAAFSIVEEAATP
jgi:hypothetical protein